MKWITTLAAERDDTEDDDDDSETEYRVTYEENKPHTWHLVKLTFVGGTEKELWRYTDDDGLGHEHFYFEERDREQGDIEIHWENVCMEEIIDTVENERWIDKKYQSTNATQVIKLFNRYNEREGFRNVGIHVID